MRKLVLDDLRVESFETVGGVFAHWQTQDDCRPPPSEQDGCRGSCYADPRCKSDRK
jgi:hypothetical protein